MGRKAKRISWWIRRRSHLPVILISSGVVALLVLNEETSFEKRRELDERIKGLKAEIEQAEDSARYYKQARKDLLTNAEDLEYVAREQYGLQRPTEDVYIVK